MCFSNDEDKLKTQYLCDCPPYLFLKKEGAKKAPYHVSLLFLLILNTRTCGSSRQKCKKNKKNQKCVLHSHSRCGVAVCILPKVVIFLHIFHICICELCEVLRATIVHVVWRRIVEILFFIFSLGFHFRQNLLCLW